MKKLIIASAIALTATAATSVSAQVKVGLILGFTGPIESLTPHMASAAELALKEASDSGAFMGGKTVSAVRADSTCVDAAAASAAAERLITSDKVSAIVGADCSGVTTAIANNVAVPKGVVMVSPSATSPALSTIKDKGFFFRTAPSDARQGQVLADIVMGRGIKSLAISYTNNDYGKGLAESFTSAYKAAGGKVEISAAHEDGKGDYSAEVGALAASGAKALAVFGYLDQGGKGIVQTSLDAGAFDQFIFADGMIGDAIVKAIGKDLTGTFGTLPGSESAGATTFLKVAKAGGMDGDGPYRAESYDAAALIVLAMQAAKSTDREAIQGKLMSVANAPGVEILPGELAKGLKLLAEGKEINYQGATNVELNDVGEASGSYKEVEVKGGKFATMKVH